MFGGFGGFPGGMFDFDDLRAHSKKDVDTEKYYKVLGVPKTAT